MAGHSKWHNIRHKKAKTDAAKAKVYAKISKIITMAAKEGADPSLNPVLETALQKAKSQSLPKHVIEKAIAKGSGMQQGQEYSEQYYEGYGPGGVALYIRALTDNTNRTSAHLKALFTKYGYSLGEPGSVAWQFSEQGQIVVSGVNHIVQEKGKKITTTSALKISNIEEDILHTPAIDWVVENDDAHILIVIVRTKKQDFIDTLHILQAKDYHIADAGLVWRSDNTVDLDADIQHKFEDFIEQLYDDEDVDEIYHNAV